MNSTPSSIHMRSVIDRGCKNESIVWAKLVGHKHWPAKIISDELRRSRSDYQQADSFKKESDDALVYFFGTYDIAWVNSKKAIVSWEQGKLSGYKDTSFDTEEILEVFTTAVREATDFLIESSEIAMNRSEGAVWAKLLGHKHWPAKIISDELRQSRSDYQQADSFKKESDDALVYFFGTHDIAWVNSKKAIVSWEKGKVLGHDTATFSSEVQSELFEIAVEEADMFSSESGGLQKN